MSNSGIIEASRLKELQGRLEKKKAERSVISIQLNEYNEKERQLDKDIANLSEELKKYTKRELRLSEHAILRFIERVELIRPEEVKNKVITEELLKLHSILGDGEFPIGDTGFSAIIKGNIIITIK